ncbi:hypothetical protein WH50_22095 [Pokkaliibacter plantistimulans]|uniref:Uncharacterized protein n=1 Tax=Pokkaliibacter plantistimulans TaxID=1635171 RepID=A0ABX5LUL7_9GAMM|nr:hypothetical protein WH50_22095 [Pokkaliibacter plantistimulans]
MPRSAGCQSRTALIGSTFFACFTDKLSAVRVNVKRLDIACNFLLMVERRGDAILLNQVVVYLNQVDVSLNYVAIVNLT